MQNYKLKIEYDGTEFSGWQKQKNLRTVQEEIEKVLYMLYKEKISLKGSGRTDAKVHALSQVANYIAEDKFKEEELLNALNANMPQDIVILSVEKVDNEFDSLRSTKVKHYRYVINNSKFGSALNKDREYHYKYSLDIEAMNMAANDLLGEHDFKGFMSVGSPVKTTVKTIYDIKITKLGERIVIDVYGSGFLYNMVRIIAGTLVEIGSGKLDICTIKNMILTKDRTLGGKTLPPHGLYLVEVIY